LQGVLEFIDFDIPAAHRPDYVVSNRGAQHRLLRFGEMFADLPPGPLGHRCLAFAAAAIGLGGVLAGARPAKGLGRGGSVRAKSLPSYMHRPLAPGTMLSTTFKNT